MRTFLSGLLLALPFGLALFAGLAQQIFASGKVDPDGLYVVLAWQRVEMEAQAEALGARLIGPEATVFGRFISADLEVAAMLEARGFVVLAGSALAQICGVVSEVQEKGMTL